MQAQHHDRHLNQERDHPPPSRNSAAVPAQFLDEHGFLIDQLIQFAFDTLGVCHLELRVYEAK